MISGISMGTITIDCDDEDGLCEFYHKLLGGEKCMKFAHNALYIKEGVEFLFVEEDDYLPPVWPAKSGKQQKQIHFDFGVPDLAAAVKYAEYIGAVKAEVQFGGSEFTTMLDPAGHPFCLCSENNIA